MTEFRRNTRNIGSYLIGNTLGEGAFGKVKLGTHVHTGEKVAIKILDKKKMQEDPDDIARVQSEIAILKKMRHKNIIQLYEIMESTRNIYLIMEYCEEKELFDYINTRKRLTEAEALKFFQEIIDTLDYLHCQNIVHRDLKPENLLLDYKLSIKLSDFGLSRTYTNDKLLSTPCGTPSYAPPEMLNGEEYHGLLSDIWSVGVVLYAMLSGYLPFDESNEEINCQKIINGEYILPDWISDSAADLIRNILVTDPYYRYDLEQIKSHPWFNSTAPCLRPGVIIGYHKMPIDEYILDQVENFGYNKLKTRDNLLNNRFCMMTAIYYLLLRKFIKEGRVSISDLESEEYLRYIEDEKNVIEASREENYKSLQDMLEECHPDQENDDNIYLNSHSLTPSKRVSESIKNYDKNEEDSPRKQSKRYSSNIIENGHKLSFNSSKEKVLNLNTERQPSLNKTDIDNLSFKNFDSIFPNTRHRSTTINQQENYAKRFANRKSLYVHEDLGKFFDAGKERRMSAFSGVRSTIMDSMPRISVVLNHFRRNTCRNDNLKLDDDKLLAFLKLNSFPPNNSPGENTDNHEESESNNKMTLNFTTNANQSNEKINNFNSSSHENSLASMSSDSNLEESVETVHSRKRSIVNYNISADRYFNDKKSPTNVNKLNRTNIQPKTEAKNNNLSNKTNYSGNSLMSSRLKKIKFSSRSKFIFKSNSKDKYNIEKLRPKVIFKINKDTKESSSKLIKAQIIKKLNNVSILKRKKVKVDNQISLQQDEREKFLPRNKFIKDSNTIKNDTSFEKSLSKTPHRNLSYSSHYAKKSRKNRVEEMPWNLKKKIIEVENYAYDTNSNQLDSIKGIIDRYEKFKQKHCNFKKAKNQEKKKKSSSQKIGNNLNKNDITIQDIQSSPIERFENENENEKNSQVKNTKINFAKNTTPNKIKQFVCHEGTSSIKTQWKNSGTVKYTNYNTISSTKYNNNKKSQTDKKGNKTTPFRDNYIQESVFSSTNHIKEMFFSNAKKNVETNYKKNKIWANNFNFEENNSSNYNPNKTNPVSNRIFSTEDNHMSNLKFATGPIDFNTIYTDVDLSFIIDRLIDILNKKKITHIQTNPYKFKCSKNGISFEVQLFKLDGDEDYFTLKFRMFQGGSVNYRKLCQSIISEIY